MAKSKNKLKERIVKRINELSIARERVQLFEQQADIDSMERLSYNTQAANLFDIIYELNWVINVIDECA